MPYDFYEALPTGGDRALAILVHWGQGNSMYLPYTTINPAIATRTGNLIIYAGMIVIRARLGRPESGETLSLSDQARTLADAMDMPSFSAPVDDIMAPDGFDTGSFAPPDDFAAPPVEGEHPSVDEAVFDDTQPSAEPPSDVVEPEPPAEADSSIPVAAHDDPLAGLDLFGAIANRQEPPIGVTDLGADPAPVPEPPDLEPPVPHPADTQAAEMTVELPPSAAAPMAQTPGTEQTLEQFLLDLQDHRVLALYHLPEAGFFVEMFQLTQKGEKPLEV